MNATDTDASLTAVLKTDQGFTVTAECISPIHLLAHKIEIEPPAHNDRLLATRKTPAELSADNNLAEIKRAHRPMPFHFLSIALLGNPSHLLYPRH